ncbi:hypothetical protein M404DRAFT_17191 [Pisolithus tinctorius Marx 270]|uniref:Alpha-type protein kinase domain-containing protein n=1 Tax=Pisolithus tinctorius Marx 270 TaxID=870435 RepID=A0A0C3NG42_PISTI|nr:hypothetical protein M404DRAFT_17191 [Pisolithus tinctorius Marx 270]
MLDRDLFVAKCFFDIGTGESVTTTDNKKYLELVQLNLGKWFLGHFCELAKQQGVSIFSVMKFSGTLEHLSSMDKLGITISAFAHFAYEYSKHKLVFADIQGSPMTVNGHDGMVLFDLMTHTVTSYGNQLHHSVNDSGIGNHGKDGIKIFMQQHQCDYICVNMGLPSIVNTHGDEA